MTSCYERRENVVIAYGLDEDVLEWRVQAEGE